MNGFNPTTGFALDDVSVAYPGRTVLSHLHLDAVPPGALVALAGPNGSGKSSLLRAIAGLQPASGRVLLDGRDLARLSRRDRLRQVGYLPQALPQPTTLVAYESLMSALRASRPDLSARQAEQAIEEVVAQLDLDALALRPLAELSGGQRQMVGLAQVLVRSPHLLLLDEPTSALDLRWQLRVLETMRERTQRAGAIAIVAIHDLNLALRFCSHLVVVGEGGLLAAGAPDAVLDARLLHRAWGVEARIERCSRGHLLVLADRASTATPSLPTSAGFPSDD